MMTRILSYRSFLRLFLGIPRFLFGLVHNRAVWIISGYFLLDIAGDQFSLAFKSSLEITPWFPPAGLRLAWPLIFGLQYAPLILVDELLDSLWLEPISAPFRTHLLYAPVPMLVYGSSALILKRVLRVDLRRGHLADILKFLLLGLTAPVLVAAALGTAYIASQGLTRPYNFFSILNSWWLDDVVGVLSVTPFLVVLSSMARDVLPIGGRRLCFRDIYAAAWHWIQANYRWQTVLVAVTQMAAIVLVLWLVFITAKLHIYYCLFFPLIWIALRFGLPGAMTGILVISVGSMLAIKILDYHLENMGELQVLIFALSGCGLLLGAIVNERNLSVEELRHREELFRSMTENALDVVAILDANGTVRYVSPAIERMMGYLPDEVMGQNVFKLFSPEHEEANQSAFNAFARDPGNATAMEFRLKHKDGSWRILECIVKNLVHSPAVNGIIMNIRDITERKQNEALLKKLLQRVGTAHESERKRVARELHDGVGQILFAAMMELQSAEEESLADHQAAAVELGRGKELLAEAIKEIQQISRNLRPDKLDDLGLWPAVRELCNSFSDRSGIEIAMNGPDVVGDLPPEIELTIYRIIQEALSNIERHSKASRTELSLVHQDGEVMLIIADNGQGFDFRDGRQRSSKTGLGLVHIRERAEGVGGAVQIDSLREKGSQIIIRLPFGGKQGEVA